MNTARNSPFYSKNLRLNQKVKHKMIVLYMYTFIPGHTKLVELMNTMYLHKDVCIIENSHIGQRLMSLRSFTGEYSFK